MTLLCPACTQILHTWYNVIYNDQDPREWPGGTHIMDSRTTHRERRADWETKTARQITLLHEICLANPQ